MNVLKLGIVASATVAIVAIVAVVALPLILQATAQPRISLTEVFILEGGCFEDYLFFYTLVNSGGADGFALVEFLIDGVVVFEFEYFVIAGEAESHTHNILVEDCLQHDTDVRLGNVRKA